MARFAAGLLFGAAAGAAAAYFLDPQGGRTRRKQVLDQGAAVGRQGARGAAGMATEAANRAKGAAMSAAPTGTTSHEDLGDVGLARKVESEIFRAADAPKGNVSVNVENGVVTLRGEVERDWIERLGREAESVGGVQAVRNLLHTPGTPAPGTTTVR
jgi:osmotically-inducible protein OsmY